MASMNISIKDVARRAGVSVTTVSRVINQSPALKDSTRKRVLKVIEELHFRPNINARGLIGGKTNLLSLLIPGGADFISALYFTEILRGINNVISKAGYRLIIHQPESFDAQSGYKIRMDDFTSDGFFVMAPTVDDRLVKSLEVQNAPAVLISGRSQYLDWVDIDNTKICAKVVEKLVELGHHRIAYIRGGSDDSSTLGRLEGYRIGLGNSQIPFDLQLVIKTGYDMKGGYQATRKLLGLGDPPTAIFAFNDTMAIGAIRAVGEAGLSVPGDVSVVGFDDIESACSMIPSLSTVQQPVLEMGQIAGETLVSRLGDLKKPQKTVVLDAPLILRESVSRARSKSTPDSSSAASHEQISNG